MELSLNGLKERRVWDDAGIRIPGYDPAAVAERTRKDPVWIHFGAGNIFRIFIGGLMDRLLEEGLSERGILCAETFDYDIIDKIYKPYDNLVLAVTMSADGTMKKQVLGSICEAVHADSQDGKEWGRLREVFTSPGLQIASFTITEKGYALKGTDGAYLPFVKADLENGPQKPKGAAAVFCALLYERFRAGRFPLAAVSMDNCSRNGEKLRQAVLTVAGEWAERGLVEKEFLSWLQDESSVTFPWTMIDKITPRPSEEAARTLAALGLSGMEPVVTKKNTYIAPFVNAEGPQYLVIEDSFPNGRPPLERAGVYMTSRETVNDVERMKVTACLNPLHTALAVYGCLLGYTSIAAEMEDSELLALVRGIGLKEGMRVVQDPGILSPEEFVREVIEERFPNRFIPDAPQRIACDTSQKVGIRYGETIKAWVEKYGSAGELIYIPLAIAGWLRYLLGVDDAGKPFPLSPDPMLAEFKEALAGITLGEEGNAGRADNMGNADDAGNGDVCRQTRTACACDAGKAHPIDDLSDKLHPLLSNRNLFGCDLYEAGIGGKIECMFREETAGPGAVRAVLKKYVYR